MAARTQDMPPPGGYQKIEFKRIPARKYFTGYQMILGYLGVTAGSAYLYYLNTLEIDREDIEMRSAKLATFPLLLAERDREYLKQLRRNRDEEADLMKNVAGWKVGTWYGEPVFKTLPKDKIIDPHWQDFCAHAPYRIQAHRTFFHMYD
ncbi:CLUMA_CG014016, isoform A [Clunio marinus]|uniref:NADH dehydrogenase [ubiquinone] 1 alpha subcomplex subunit 13 n=1 Tax=Clunio marinus TaxID=568069 RepID=A0A1J1IQI0_9DIPT|nr:CLUMA_CG014016, isoform A [Clunio marinus]